MTKHSFEIATAKTRQAKKWKNRKVTWEELVEKCKETTRTQETVAEYKSMSRDEQSAIKDVGGFVGGYLTEGVRRNGHVAFRTLATLDIDYGTVSQDIWDDFCLQYDCNALMYSTHKHTPEKPRLRLVIPFSRRVKCEEYEPVCRRITASLGIDLFDVTTYQLTRLFYWPSTSEDGEYFFRSQDGEPLNPDDLLETYDDWSDCSEWPLGSREAEVRKHEMRKAGDPTEKPGLIGAWCRAYTIEDVIDKFLSDVYEPTVNEGRYTYTKGTVSNGLVCYEHKWAYPNNETDPASRQLCNAFDLVRIHKFGEMDEGSRADDVTKLPSYKRMMEFAGADKEVKRLIVKERKESAAKDFAGIEEDSEDDSWTDQLDTDKKGNIKSTAGNALVVLENDPALKGKLRYDEFRDRPEIVGPLPWGRKSAESYVRRWTDVDDANLRIYMEKAYGITGKDKIKDAKVKCFGEHTYHPVRDYLNGLEWDRTPRLDRAVIDYIGADDNELTRAVTKTWMVAAVARIFKPGCKMDYCLILAGAQGIGKSTFFEVMGGEWYNGNLSAMSSDKQSLEQLRGSWIFELQELDGMKKHEVSSVKAFITNRTDKYRGAYKENTDEFPRQCVFGGTTNEAIFLKDDTGERRFWPVQVSRELQKMGDPREALVRDRDQLWAEAVAVYKTYEGGCKLKLTSAMESTMAERCKQYSVPNMDKDFVDLFLSTKLPVDWDSYTLDQRRHYYKDSEEIQMKGIVERLRASGAEFLQEYMGIDGKNKDYRNWFARFRTAMDAPDIKKYWRFIGRQKYRDGNLYKAPETYEKYVTQDVTQDDI